MVGENELLRAYYYHCLPYQSNPPTGDERRRYAAKHRFVTALRHIPRFDVRLGKLAYRGTDRDGQPIFQQKRVDLMLGVDMALLAASLANTRDLGMSTGPGLQAEIDFNAAHSFAAAVELLKALGDDDADAVAVEYGWPSAYDLMQFFASGSETARLPQ